MRKSTVGTEPHQTTNRVRFVQNGFRSHVGVHCGPNEVRNEGCGLRSYNPSYGTPSFAFPLPQFSSHRSKTRVRQSFVMTESENERLSENKAVAKSARQKSPMKCSPKQSRTTVRTKPESSVKKRLRWTRSSARNDSFDSSSSDTETSERRPKKPKPPPEWDSSSSSHTESHVRIGKPKHLIKPPKYNGTTSFETFLAQFRKCSAYNHWTKDEQLVYLRSSLENEAGRLVGLRCRRDKFWPEN